MILHHFGHRLVRDHNEKYGTDHTPSSLFRSQLDLLFVPDKRDLIYLSNSPFAQKAYRPDGPDGVRNALAVLHNKIEEGYRDGSTMPGGPPDDLGQSTSGMNSAGLDIPLDDEDVWAAWLGMSVGVGVSGGLVVYDEEVSLSVFEGWRAYRNFLDATPRMKPRQLNTWNAYWVMDPGDESHVPAPLFQQRSRSGLSTAAWAQVVLALAILSAESRLLHVSSFGQTNKTVGLLPLAPGDLVRLSDLYEALIQSAQTRVALVQLVEKTDLSFREACGLGQLGLEAFRPHRVYDRTPEDIAERTFHEAWLLLMLDNKQLMRTARDAASRLHEYALGAERGKTDRANRVKQVISAKTLTQFVSAINPIVEEKPDPAYVSLVETAADVPSGQFPLFIQLVKLYFNSQGAES